MASTRRRSQESKTSFKQVDEDCKDCHKSRRLLVMRHGERCDFAFGRSWINRCFDDKDEAYTFLGIYKQIDLNLPLTMVRRESYKDFLKDSPLTEVGRFQARATGDALKRAGLDIKHVYCSPSLRCVQTAQNVIEGMENSAKIYIEPSAFEWCGWYKNGMPTWMTPHQLASCGFNVDAQHKPFMTKNSLNIEESVPDYYERCHKLAQHVLAAHEEEGGDILIVAHAGSLDTFTRRLRGKLACTSQEMHQILTSFTYCCICCLAEDTKTKKWSLQEPPIPPLHEFDWKVLL